VSAVLLNVNIVNEDYMDVDGIRNHKNVNGTNVDSVNEVLAGLAMNKSIELMGAHEVDMHEKPEKKDDIDANFDFNFNSEYDEDAFELLSAH
jgi:hypothetical protein